MTISRVQGNARGSGINNSTTSVTLSTAPTSGNVLVLAFGSVQAGIASSVSGISQAGVNWARQTGSAASFVGWVMDSEIWVGIVGSNASTSVTISHATANQSAADICEYSGIATVGFLDKTATAYCSSEGTYPQTGTTATTTQAEELWVGSVWEYGDFWQYSYINSCTNGFTVMDGATISNYPLFQCLAYLEKIVSSTGQAYSQTGPYTRPWCGCIVTLKAGEAQLPALRYSDGSGTHGLRVVPNGSGNPNMGGIPKMRKDGVTYDVYLVETTDPTASHVRIKTTQGVKAIQCTETCQVSQGCGICETSLSNMPNLPNRL